MVAAKSNIKTYKAFQTEVESSNRIALSVDCVIFGFDENKLKVLLIRSDLKKRRQVVAARRPGAAR